LRQFQSEQGISADGIVGPNTRKTLLDALERAAA
jgi:peptidoglycan hydrolase-like protein with peptidoglycan-binding domain